MKHELEIVIKGTVGSGKTTIANAIEKMLLKEKIQINVKDDTRTIFTKNGIKKRLLSLARRDNFIISVKTEQISREKHGK